MVFQKGSFWGFSVHIISEQTSKDKSILLCRSHLSPPRTCPYRWPHASADSNGCVLLPFFMEEATSIGFQKAGVHTLSIQPISSCPRPVGFHQPLFTFYIYTGADRGLISDTVTLTRYFKPTARLAHWPEIQAFLYCLGRSKYTSRKEISALDLKDAGIPQGTVPTG